MIAIGCVMIYLAVSKRYEPDHGGFARAAPALAGGDPMTLGTRSR